MNGSFGIVEGDEVLLRQAFSNLIRNSVEACDAGRVPAAITMAGSHEPPGHITIRVVDNGPGIPEDALPRLFTPFFTTKAQGTGLGLAMVQKIVVSHNGRISALNPAGDGAVFQVTLPLSTRPTPSETESQAPCRIRASSS